MTDRKPLFQQDKQDQNPTPDAGMIQRQLERIFASPEFQATNRQREFLQFVVAETIAGRSDEIKGYTVATQVFGRSENFDQATDPLVSIQANKLRRALERYYLVTGQNDPVRIDIPKGTYVPTFIEQAVVEPDAALSSEVSDTDIEDSWPSILILPFKNLTGDPEKDFLGIGFSTELAIEVARFQEIKVLFPLEGQIEAASASKSRFVFDGNIFEDSTGIKITAHMTDTKTGKQIWGDTHRSNIDATKFIAFQEKVAQVIAAKTTGELGVIPKVMSIESRNKPPTELKTYEAILRFYEYDQTLTPESFMRAMDALKQAASIEPDCGQVWSLLARLYAHIYTLDFPGFENPLEKAIEHAEKGVRLYPNNQRTLAILALVRFYSNELSSALTEANRALELNPNSLFVLDGLAYVMTLSGEWERGTALARKSIRLNPCYRPAVHYALWVDCLRQENYDDAYLETMGLKRPAVFWYPLAKAATLGLLGRYEEGEKFVKKLLELRPDFLSKGRVLIERYIKFEEIVDRVLEGMNKVGLSID